MKEFLYISGIIVWLLFISYMALQLIFGERWKAKLFGNLFIGKGLIDSSKGLVKEINSGKLTDDTLGSFIGNVIKRFTRIGIFSLMIASAPLILLLQQNRLISSQNKLFENQNNLVKDQNKKIENQTNLLRTQNKLFGNQNFLVEEQNEKAQSQVLLIEAQNKKIDVQNKLIESDRRGNTFFLLGEVMAELNIELRNSDNIEKRLSKSLIGQIISISNIMRPYQYLEPNGEFSKYLSLERGQLLSILTTSNIYKADLDDILSQGNFQYSKIDRLRLTIPKYGIDLSYSEIGELSLRGTEEGSEIGASIQLNNSNVEYLTFQFVNTAIGISCSNSSINKIFGWRCEALALSTDNSKIDTLILSNIGDVSEISVSETKVIDISEVNVDTVRVKNIENLFLDNVAFRHGYANRVMNLKLSGSLRVYKGPKSSFGGCGTPLFSIVYDANLNNFSISGRNESKIQIEESYYEPTICVDSAFQIKDFINLSILDSVDRCDLSQPFYRYQKNY